MDSLETTRSNFSKTTILPGEVPSLKKIIHIDMDCFYAAVEMRDNPELRDVPLAVGGKSKRSVLCTANYKAREFGVRAALPTAMALKMCPNLVIVHPQFSKYKEVSEQIHVVFNEFTNIIQPLSLDEAFLDVTNFCDFHSVTAYEVAMLIKEKIKHKTKLTASAGVSHKKFLAKIASDWNKPDGIFEVDTNTMDKFIVELDVKKLPGVGPVTHKKLKQMGIETCQDIRDFGKMNMISHFGKFGIHLFDLSYGIENTKVRTNFSAKSISIENTFNDNLTLEQLLLKLPALTDELLRRYLRNLKQGRQVKNIFVKMKLPNHEKKSLEKALSEIPELRLQLELIGTNGIEQEEIQEISDRITPFFSALAKDIFNRFDNSPIRLFGLGMRYNNEENLTENLKNFDQMSFNY